MRKHNLKEGDKIDLIAADEEGRPRVYSEATVTTLLSKQFLCNDKHNHDLFFFYEDQDIYWRTR